MATLREYYEKDFRYNTKVHIKVPSNGELIEGVILYDFAGYFAFLALYIPQADKELSFFTDLMSNLQYGTDKFIFDYKVTLPSAKEFSGRLKIENKEDFEVLAQYFGDTEWISTKGMQASRRLFIYSEANLTAKEISLLKAKAREIGHELQFRSEVFRQERSKYEKPLAFISHDSRDKEIVAKNIAINLQRRLCPVWYDEFSINIGENIRDSIEKGLKECKKCILVLSPNFISNKGWTKIEFDSIFTRQILEEQKLVLPVWYKVTKDDVYNYSPSLLNIKGAVWETLGEEKVCIQLYKAIMSD